MLRDSFGSLGTDDAGVTTVGNSIYHEGFFCG